MVSRPPCIDAMSLVSQVGRLYPSAFDEFSSAHSVLTPLCFTAAFKTVGAAADCARVRVRGIEQLIRAEPRVVSRRLLIDWLDAHFPLLVAAKRDPEAPMRYDLYPERVTPRRQELLLPWTEVAYQSALPPKLTLSPAEKVMRKARESSSLRYVTQQVRRALMHNDSTLPRGGTAMLLRAAVSVAELGYFSSNEGVAISADARLRIWSRSTAEQLVAFNELKRGAKELRAMLLQLACGAASFDSVARFLYTRVPATYHESSKVLQLCQKVMPRCDGATLPPHRGFGVHLPTDLAQKAVVALGGRGCPSAKKVNAALAVCPELAEAAQRQTTSICRIAVVSHAAVEVERQMRHPFVWTSVCRNACAWKRTSRKRRRDAVAVVGDDGAVCGACGESVLLLRVNGKMIRDAAGVWTQMCSMCGVVTTDARPYGVVFVCKRCQRAE